MARVLRWVVPRALTLWFGRRVHRRPSSGLPVPARGPLLPGLSPLSNSLRGPGLARRLPCSPVGHALGPLRRPPARPCAFAGLGLGPGHRQPWPLGWVCRLSCLVLPRLPCRHPGGVGSGLHLPGLGPVVSGLSPPCSSCRYSSPSPGGLRPPAARLAYGYILLTLMLFFPCIISTQVVQ